MYFEIDKHEVCSALLADIPQSCIINTKIAERIRLNDSYQKRKAILCDVIELLADATLAVIPQSINISCQHADTLNFHRVIGQINIQNVSW